MAKLNLSTAYVHGSNSTYRKYKKWIDENFYENICAYCFIKHARTTIDHFIPVSMDKSKENDPDNLTSCCDVCQGSNHKSDYHHLHINHKRHKKIPAKYAVHDVRFEDVSTIFSLNKNNGCIEKKVSSLGSERAEFLLALFGLDLSASDDPRNDDRMQVLENISMMEQILNEKSRLPEPILKGLDWKLRLLARHEVWLYCLGTKLPKIIIDEMVIRGIIRSKAI